MGQRTYDFAANWDAGALHLGAGYQKANPTDKSADQLAVRALYELGAFTFGGYVQRDKDGFGDGLGNRTTLRLSGMYVIGNAELHLNVGRAGKYSNVTDSAASQATLGVNYNLSKRTKVYTFYTKLSDGNAEVYGGDFKSFAVGVRHNF